MVHYNTTDILVVIDMQAAFPTSCHSSTVYNILHQLRLARKRKSVILFVEYSKHGNTLSILLDSCKRYPYSFRIKKYTEDGSYRIFRFLKKHRIRPSTIRICGVNTEYCVFETVEGLIRPNVQLVIYAYACNGHEYGVNYLTEILNQRIISFIPVVQIDTTKVLLPAQKEKRLLKKIQFVQNNNYRRKRSYSPGKLQY